MPDYEYTVLKASGERSNGTLTAGTRAEALMRLERLGVQPLALREAGERSVKVSGGREGSLQRTSGDSAAPVKIGGRSLSTFTEELGSLLTAGLQLEPALGVIAKGRFGPGVNELAGRLRAAVRDGQSFSSALKTHARGAVSSLYTTMVSAGERSGTLPSLVTRLATHLNESMEVRNRLIQSMVYPAFLLLAGVLLVVLFMTVLLPEMTKMLESGNREMPPTTAALIGTGRFFEHYWWLLLGSIVLGAVAFWRGRSNAAFRQWTDRFVLKIPVLGGLLRAGFLSQLTLTLSTLLSNGVTLVNALDLMRGLSGNVILRREIERVSQEVSDGANLSSALRRSEEGLFPPMMCDVVAVGEQTGDLPQALGRVAARADKELGTQMARLLALIQPLIILSLAGVVLVIASALVSGIAETISSLRFDSD